MSDLNEVTDKMIENESIINTWLNRYVNFRLAKHLDFSHCNVPREVILTQT